MAEKAPELVFGSGEDARPDLYIVRPESGLEAEIGQEVRHDVLVDIIIDVDGQERQLCINVTRGTLGNDQSVKTYFDRFAEVRQDAYGNVWRDYDRVNELAERALGMARRSAELTVVE